MPASTAMKVAVLHCWDPINSYYDDWIKAIQRSDRFSADDYYLYDLDNIDRLRKALPGYDAVIALHSTNASHVNFKFMLAYTGVLLKRTCPLITFIGNELNYFQPGKRLWDRIQLFQVLKPEIIASQIMEASAKAVYSVVEGSRIEAVPHALNPDTFYPQIDQAERPIQLGMRTTRYPDAFLGDQERNLIVEHFRDQGASYGLEVDIDNSFANKLPPDEWALLLNKCQGTVGTESGSSFLESDDTTAMAIRDYVFEKEGLKEPRGLSKSLIKWFSNYQPWLNYKLALKLEHYLNRAGILEYHLENVAKVSYYDFQEVYARFYKDYDAPLSGKCISSRHFDAIGTKTVNILFRGHYNGILKADEHYLPVERDFSNLGKVIEQFKDVGYRKELTDRAFDYVMAEHTYDKRTEELYQLLS